MISPKFDLIKQDIKSLAKVALLFLVPVAIIYVGYVSGNIESTGFSWDDFFPNLFIQGVIVSYILAEVLALLKKFVESNKY